MRSEHICLKLGLMMFGTSVHSVEIRDRFVESNASGLSALNGALLLFCFHTQCGSLMIIS